MNKDNLLFMCLFVSIFWIYFDWTIYWI